MLDKRLQILVARDKRVEFIEKLIYLDNVIISLRSNYPGSNKDNEATRKVIGYMDTYIKENISVNKIHKINNGEGLTYVYIINSQDVMSIKGKTVDIENTHKLGRLVDIDVYYKNIKSISRSELNLSKRKCFICNNDAFVCIVEKAHNLDSLINYFKRNLLDYEKSLFRHN